MSFRTRKRGTPRQIGQKFPVQEKKRLPAKIRLKRISTNKEAEYWIRNNPNSSPFASNLFASREDALVFVKKLKNFGVTARVGEILSEPRRIKKEGGPYAATLIVKVPKEKSEDFEKAFGYQASDEFDKIESTPTHDVFRMWWD